MTATARGLVAAQLRADRDSWDVRAYPYFPANVTTKKPVVSIWRRDLLPGATTLTLRHPLTVNLYGSRTAGEDVEDELDGLLDELMVSLQKVQEFAWEAAARTTWGQLSGWQITGHMEPNNPYPALARAESSTP